MLSVKALYKSEFVAQTGLIFGCPLVFSSVWSRLGTKVSRKARFGAENAKRPDKPAERDLNLFGCSSTSYLGLPSRYPDLEQRMV